jgi:ribulose-phosphate 3-epimerase
MVLIVPSILTNDPQKALELLQRAEPAVERVSVDIIDGFYADNKTVEPSLFEGVETSLCIDYQLMVRQPVNWVERCIRGQADRIIGHIEQMKSQEEFVNRVMDTGVGLGLGIDLDTPVESVEKHLLANLDVVLVMSVKAGFGGQEFNNTVLQKISSLKELREEEGAKFKIHVDGGVNADNIKNIKDAGADEVSIGVRIFEENLRENIEALINAANL